MSARRAGPVAAAAALVLACAGEELYPACPGEVVATFAFGGTLDPSAPLLPGETALPACEGAPDAVAFDATIAFHPIAADRAALCTGRRSSTPAEGARDGAAIDVQTPDAAGAVLTGCDPLCRVRITERLAGSLRPSAEAPEGFDGVLVDTAVPLTPDTPCGACVLPCAARYAIRGE